MLKKFITGLLALTLMTGMAGTITSFADDVEGTEGTSTTIEKSREGKEGKFGLFGDNSNRPERGEKSENGERPNRSENGERPEKGDRVKIDRENMTDEEIEALKAEREVKKAEREAKREETLNTMYPEIVETNAALRTDLETSKEEVKSIKDQIDAITGVDKEANKAEATAFMESLKAQLEAEEITREEAKELFDNYRETQKAANEDSLNMSDENKAQLEEIKTEFQSFKEERATISKELKEAVTNEDSAAFKVAFDKSIVILETTLSLENQKIEVLTDVLNNLQ